MKLLLLVVLLIGVTYAQRPGFAPFPWDHMYTQASDASTTRRPTEATTSTTLRPPAGSGIVDRFGNEVTFRYFNNVPIQGPMEPCIGCTYRLTNKGFVLASSNRMMNSQSQGFDLF